MTVEFLSISEGQWEGERFITKPKIQIAKRILEKYAGYADESIIEVEDPRIESLLFGFSGYIQKAIRANLNNSETLKRIDKVSFWIDSYIKDKAPKNKVIYEDLERRISRAKECIDGI